MEIPSGHPYPTRSTTICLRDRFGGVGIRRGNRFGGAAGLQPEPDDRKARRKCEADGFRWGFIRAALQRRLCGDDEAIRRLRVG
ncbi:hypothetical protein QYF36_025283 [Acer negundo]|nr:hypothetical protein QYF36_025283 [Acer negundo]